MKKLFLILLLVFLANNLFATAPPAWVNRLPFTEDAFWGVGKAKTKDEAVKLARKDILMQMNSHVEAIVSMNIESGNNTYQELTEDLEVYFSSNALRGAEFVEEYIQDDDYWVLMKYCDECGSSMVKAALLRYESSHNYNSQELIQIILNDDIVMEKIIKKTMVERRLKEFQSEEYSSSDIRVKISDKDKKIIIMIVNFVPYETQLSDSQKIDLKQLSESLLEELRKLDYKTLDIVGHANPVGGEDEHIELMELSKNRAKTMESQLLAAGLNVNSVNWKGGDETLGDVTTQEGKGLNRRVELIVSFE